MYRGSETSLLGTKSDYTYYHGKDGLGDWPDTNPPDPSLVKPQHGVQVLLDLVNEHKG